MMWKNMLVRSLTLTVLLISLTACGPSSQTRPDNAEQIAEHERQALNYINRGEFSAAGEEYLTLAEANPVDANLYKLKAAGAFFEDRDIHRAGEILATVETGENSTQQLQKNILLAKIALSQGDAKSAIDVIGPAPASGTSVNLASAYHDVKATAFEQIGLKREALQERLFLTGLPDTASELERNDRALWRLLSGMNTEELEAMRVAGSERQISWSELALIYRTHSANPKNLKAVINDWSARYPGHNALNSIVPGLIESSENLTQRPQHIAVLLPMTGRYRDASKSIRDGFIAAWYEDNADRSKISFYNTDSLNINENYQQAVTDGADFIVGPLEKVAIERLVEQGNLTVKTLVLNYYDGNLESARFEQVHPGSNFFQFGLSPENEAEQVAERAYFDGNIRALVITSGDERGDRVFAAFQKRWQELGGVLLEHARYTSEISDYSDPIRKLLNTDSSKERAKELRAVLNRSIYSEERRRQDADFIFIASQPDIARQVMPHIRFLRASNLPVYATSHIYTGQPDPVRDADMNNIIFADIPWNLNPDFYQSRTKSVIAETWPQLSSNYQRLYALGYDAYSLIPELPGLASDNRNRFNGATGNLYLAGQGKIRRYLTWAHFVDGQPQVFFSNSP